MVIFSRPVEENLRRFAEMLKGRREVAKKSFETCNKPCLGSLRLPLTTLSPSVTLDLLSDLLCFVASLLRCLLLHIVPYCSFTIFLQFFCRLCTISNQSIHLPPWLSVGSFGFASRLGRRTQDVCPWQDGALAVTELTIFPTQGEDVIWRDGVMVDMWYDMV